MLVTVRARGKVHRYVGSHYVMVNFDGQPDTVHVTVTALQFETYKEMETCLQEIVTRTTAVEEFVNAHRVNSIADLEIDPDNRAFAEIERQLLCPICWSAARDTALNCGHTYCRECADNLVDCANCRQRVTEKKRIYL